MEDFHNVRLSVFFFVDLLIFLVATLLKNHREHVIKEKERLSIHAEKRQSVCD